MRTGAPWRDVPERFGPWQTVYHYFNEWRKQGVYDRIIEALQILLDANDQIDWDLWCVDGSSIRTSRAATGAIATFLGMHPFKSVPRPRYPGDTEAP